MEALATTGNVQLITSRAKAQAGARPGTIVCTQPSPDYAFTFGRTATNDIKGTVEGQAAEVNSGYGSTETVAAPTGRSGGVLGLRDGLYAACEIAANGNIGDDAYAIILSQYGDLLVSLVGAGGTGTASASTAVDLSKRATLAALLVACISEHDPTRGNRAATTNPLLDIPFCKSVLSRALTVATATAAAAPAVKATGAVKAPAPKAAKG